jgi:Holliday junction resolvasome RuvABC endonuclease subunit
MKTVLALDLATNTGWALRNAQGALSSGVARFELREGESEGARLLRFVTWLREFGRVDVIAFERPFAKGRGFVAGIGKELAALVRVEAASTGALELDVAPGTLKKHATGHGAAKKGDMVRAAARRWQLARVPRDDQADALCVLSWAIEKACGDEDDSTVVLDRVLCDQCQKPCLTIEAQAQLGRCGVCWRDYLAGVPG